MRVSPQTLVQTYASFKSAAMNHEVPDNPISYGGDTEIMEAQVDNDPSTKDTLVASFWDGNFSGPTNIMTFSEYQEKDRLVLQYDHKEVGFGANQKTSTVKLDAQSAEVLFARDEAGILLTDK